MQNCTRSSLRNVNELYPADIAGADGIGDEYRDCYVDFYDLLEPQREYDIYGHYRVRGRPDEYFSANIVTLVNLFQFLDFLFFFMLIIYNTFYDLLLSFSAPSPALSEVEWVGIQSYP